MRHPFVLFVLAIGVPSALVMVGSEHSARIAQERVLDQSALRIAQLTLGTVMHELDARADTMTDAVRVTPAAASTRAVELVSRLTGAQIGIEIGGVLTAATDSVPSAAAGGTGTPSPRSIIASVSSPADPDRGLDEELVVRAAPVPLARPVSDPMRLVMALLCWLPALTFWLLAHRSRSAGPRRRRRRDPAAAVLLAAVPVVAAIVLTLQVRRDFHDTARQLLARDLTRSLAVIETLGATASPAVISELTGFHAARVEGGSVVESTFATEAPAIAALRSPPPSFTTSGLVETPVGTSQYVSRRLGASGFATILAPPPQASEAALRKMTTSLMAALVGWLLLAGWWARTRFVALGPEVDTA